MVRERGIEPLPGVRRWLTRLRETGWRQAVASSAPPANIEVIIEVLGLARVFDAWVSAEEVAHGKPAPDVFLRAAEKLGVAARPVRRRRGRAGRRRGGPARRHAHDWAHLHGSRPLVADIVVGSLEHLPDDAFERLVGDAT